MDTLSLSITDYIATITITRPQQRNAINYEMWTRFAELFSRLDEDSTVRLVLIRGAGDEAFSAGGDITEFEERRSDPWQAKIYNGKVELALQNLSRLRKPTIALIKGYCVGAGFVLAAYCDLRLAADNAMFGVPVAKLGALVNYFELERMIQIIGVGPTLDLLLTARLMNAAEAKSVGFCNQILPLSELEQHVDDLAKKMCKLAPLTQQWHKKMVKTVLYKADIIDLEPEEAALPDACFDTDDYAEGVLAFIQKREPVFRGQ